MAHPREPDSAQAEMYKTLSLNLRYYRNRLQMTQEQVAALAGFSSKYLSLIECSCFDHPPSLQIIFRLAEALQIPPYRLFKPLG